jgi:hypothetical protein
MRRNGSMRRRDPLGGVVMRIGTRGTTPYRLGRSNEGSAMTRLTIQKILEDHGVFPET